MTADQKSSDNPARTVTSEALGPRSSWHAMDSFFDPSFPSESTSARSALVTPTNVGEMTQSSVAIVSLYEASTQVVTSPKSSSPPTGSTPSVSANEWATQLHSSQMAPQTQSQNAAHSLDVPSQPISSASSLTSSFIGTTRLTTVDSGNLLTSRAIESSLKNPWTTIVGTSTFIPLLGSLSSTVASDDLKVMTSLTPSWIETYRESRVVPSTREEVVRTSFDTKLQSSGLASATTQTVQQVSVGTSFGSSVYSINSVPGFTQTANVFSNTLLSSSRSLFPTLTDTNLMSGNLVSVTAAAVERSTTTPPMQQVSVVTPRASSTYGAEQNSVPGFTQTANIFPTLYFQVAGLYFRLSLSPTQT
ncbi:hypothetical protein C0Q70_00697 [Pomacea canaliculata]|uniref:Uncharacterized protein n=1 Tax=Pomacea canaliculata TaxID=400727 RepID=A0A2T7PXD0_POMCA|nr:endochitinase A1-like [Pomacea canaliculata]PVD38086.1 hypothetical protein C0Q70_00697 [Pomacea canaliculata]